MKLLDYDELHKIYAANDPLRIPPGTNSVEAIQRAVLALNGVTDAPATPDNDSYTDENGAVWDVPTAWAYAQVCKARDKWQAKAEAQDERGVLMRAIVETAQKVGIVAGDLETVSGPQCLLLLEDLASAQPIEGDALDAKRWRYVISLIGASNATGPASYSFHYDQLPRPLSNPLRGGVAQHFVDAVDAAMSEHAK